MSFISDNKLGTTIWSDAEHGKSCNLSKSINLERKERRYLLILKWVTTWKNEELFNPTYISRNAKNINTFTCSMSDHNLTSRDKLRYIICKWMTQQQGVVRMRSLLSAQRNSDSNGKKTPCAHLTVVILFISMACMYLYRDLKMQKTRGHSADDESALQISADDSQQESRRQGGSAFSCCS